MIEKKQIAVIAHLRRNARAKLTYISKQTGLPVSTIFEYIKRNDEGIVRRTTSLVDFAKLGFGTRAHIILQASVEGRQALLEFLMKHKNVNSLYKINNGYDYLAEGVFKSIGALEEFLEKLSVQFRVKRKEVYHIIDDIKREEFLSDPQLACIEMN